MNNLLYNEPDVHKEHVIYQNPLLRLKVWQITSPESIVSPSIPKVFRWHYHKEVEFLAVLEGGLGIQTKHDTRELRSGDVHVLGSSQLHRTRKELPEALSYIVCQFDLAQHFDESTMPYLHYFSEVRRPLSQLNYIFRDNPLLQQQAHALIMDIYQETQTMQKGYELAISASIRRLMLLLLRSDTQGVLHGTENDELIRLQPALDYVEQHLTEKIAIEQACAVLNLSYHYFIKYFKKVMGLSFVDYVNYKRIKKAERMLLTQDVSIMEIGEAVGIPNMAQFYKLFKRHNQCSPKEFKQRMKA
ncbi:AraC family transcriptional regulator [Paenibacillus radicis (ex Xue et al. 2023)]|uniref:AraC family transcriptional regulator n=1 Tax=Paenibacillus radicis (ex Xue et al. 2023) TaxID=2972489 RepID=A0ABT1YUR8_9BACL|nr:AraC family transcriptional regulator [Paenibacillus radicis (ex Xue et al. 2023)]MCR8636568.1 AraC family transcriptional regulator [Paenibacillus radicis (ex Xue et al. 2023)]